ncbi:hypothetical protein [Thalassiella azotivora]
MSRVKGVRALAAAVAVSALALTAPGAATASTVDGGGGGEFRITTNKFTAYSCHYYGQKWEGPIARTMTFYSCSGGVKHVYGRYTGTVCVTHDHSSHPWGWYGHGCGRIF